MAVAKALGARRVIAVDINQERLDFAKSYAATDIYLPVRLILSFTASCLYHPIFSLDGIHGMKRTAPSDLRPSGANV
jgi:Zn-dependent alcohol dehydrogenase